MARDVKEIKKDRLLYTKNKLSANLAYLGILFGVLYFVSIYQSDEVIGNYYYTVTIGESVVYNLLFLLITFLSSEGLKNYKISYAYTIIAVGVMQIVRIWGIPADAHRTVVETTGELVMGDKQYRYVIICLILSAAACVLSGIIGIYKSTTLNKYKKEKGLV